ncbi:MAG TPA: BON domain-containing protein, partial [Candidatus Angelobacter sp.]|nr:BON domain-containing protein [Candidatus Angelobacter sp.]
MKNRYSQLLISALIIVAALAGCSRTRSDSEITGDALVRIHADTALASSPINVQTNSGVVTLTGTVATDTARTAAENAVKQVQGVKGVANNIQVVAATAAAAPESIAPAPPTTSKAQPGRKLRKSASAGKPVAQPQAPGTSVAQATPPVTETPKAPALPKTVTIPEGTVLPIRLIDPVDTEKNKEGDTFRASLDAPILFNDKTVIPKDA